MIVKLFRLILKLFRPKPAEPQKAEPNLAELSQGFPYPLLECTGAEAIDRLDRLRVEGKREGFSPLLISDSEIVKAIGDCVRESTVTVNEVLDRAAAIDVQAWFSERELELEEVSLAEMAGDWPEKPVPNDRFITHCDAITVGQIRDRVYLARIPTKNSWEIAAYVAFGGWNYCPDAEHQVAIARYWHDLYGAELVATGGDTLEFRVDRPPGDRQTAEALAREQFLFCTDIVHQGVETIRNLAATVLHGKVWFFWWD
jgi:hypothetical protein